MYTQIVLLLCALQSFSSYTLVQVELKNGTEITQVKKLQNKTLEKISAEFKQQEPTLREIIFVVDRYLDKHEEENNSIKKKKKPQNSPISLDESVRPFTNGHGYQFANWELIDEHGESPEGDKVGDNADTGIDSGERDDVDADYYDDSGAHIEADKHDDNREVTEAPSIQPRHQDIDRVKELRNKMFDRMKEKYTTVKRNNVQPIDKVRRKRQINYQNVPEASNQHNIDPQAIPDYMNRMLMNRPTYENSKKTYSPVLRDEYGNILYENINTVFSGGSQFGSVPRAYGMNSKNDQGYYWNHINHMQNEPIYNHLINQAVQQKPIDSHTVNNNLYKQINPTNTPDIEMRNGQQTLKSEMNMIDNNKYKMNQAPNNEQPKQNINQIIDSKTVINNGEVNSNVRNKEEMIKNVNEISKKIGSIKNKVKDRFANKNDILTSPEEKKLTFGMSSVAEGDNLNDIAGPQVHLNVLTPPNPNNFTLLNENLEVKVINNITENNAFDANVIEMNNIDKEGNTNSSLEIEVIKNIDINKEMEVNNNITENNAFDAKVIEMNYIDKEGNTNSSLEIEVIKNIDIDKEMEKPVENTVNSNTVNHIKNQPTNETVVENIAKKIEPQIIGIFTDEILTTKNSTPTDETITIEKDIKSITVPLTIDSFNETSVEEIKEESCTEFIEEETDTETSNIKLTTDTNNTTQAQFNNNGKCKTARNEDDENSVNLNLDELFNKDEFWDWLSKWTTSYMEILNENIQVLVKDEVARKLKEIHLKTEKERDSLTENKDHTESLNKGDEKTLLTKTITRKISF